MSDQDGTIKIFIVMNRGGYHGDLFHGAYADRESAEQHVNKLIDDSADPYIIEEPVYCEGLDYLIKTSRLADAEIRRLRSALEFYADEDNWIKADTEPFDYFSCHDGGQRAREALGIE